MFDNLNLEVAKITSQFTFNNVFFTADKTVATDRYKLLEVGAVAGTVKYSHAPFVLNADEVKKLSQGKQSTVEVTHLNDRSVELQQADGTTITVARVKEQFPSYAQLIPTGKPEAEITLDAGHLQELLNVMKKVDGKIKIKIYGSSKPVVMDCATQDRYAKAIIMPIKE